MAPSTTSALSTMPSRKAGDADVRHRQHQAVDHFGRRLRRRTPRRSSCRPCRPSRHKSPCRSCGRVRPWRPCRAARPASAAAVSPNFERSMSPTARQISSPTWSASSIGPIGMPNFSAAASMRELVDLLVQHHHRLQHVRRQRAVDEKARRALDRQRQPVDGADKGQRLLQKLRVGAVMADDLDQLQPRHRIEEMQAEQPLRLLQASCADPATECSRCWWRGSRPASSSARAPA